jgi:hypothetical protein
MLIEIEAPGRKWFNKDGVQTHDLAQAMGQRGVWRTWLDGVANRLNRFERYGIDDNMRKYREVRPIDCLIYGRRSEIADGERSRLPASLQPEWATWMTYDRLRPSTGSRHAVCVRVGVDGWRVETIPPTFTLGPYVAEALSPIGGWDVAIEASPLLDRTRKDFLLSRLTYWRKWVRQGQRGILPTGDSGLSHFWDSDWILGLGSSSWSMRRSRAGRVDRRGFCVVASGGATWL